MIAVQESPPDQPTVPRALADLLLAITRALVDRCVTADYVERSNGVAVVTVRVLPIVGPAACVLHGLAQDWLS